MKIKVFHNGPHQFEVQPVPAVGMCLVGRGRTMNDAFGAFLIAYQEQFGIEIEIDESAIGAEYGRRSRLMAKR